MIGSDPTLVNSADTSGFTPLMLACRNGSTSMVIYNDILSSIN